MTCEGGDTILSVTEFLWDSSSNHHPQFPFSYSCVWLSVIALFSLFSSFNVTDLSVLSEAVYYLVLHFIKMLYFLKCHLCMCIIIN